MTKYSVELTDIVAATIEVEADSEDEAREKIEAEIDSGDFDCGALDWWPANTDGDLEIVSVEKIEDEPVGSEAK
jgi:hypothetical protein